MPECRKIFDEVRGVDQALAIQLVVNTYSMNEPPCMYIHRVVSSSPCKFKEYYVHVYIISRSHAHNHMFI